MDQSPAILDSSEDKCLKLAMQFIQENADKYAAGRRPLEGPSDRMIASNVVLGNIASKKYEACVSQDRVARRSK